MLAAFLEWYEAYLLGAADPRMFLQPAAEQGPRHPHSLPAGRVGVGGWGRWEGLHRCCVRVPTGCCARSPPSPHTNNAVAPKPYPTQRARSWRRRCGGWACWAPPPHSSPFESLDAAGKAVWSLVTHASYMDAALSFAGGQAQGTPESLLNVTYMRTKRDK